MMTREQHLADMERRREKYSEPPSDETLVLLRIESLLLDMQAAANQPQPQPRPTREPKRR